MALKPRHPPGAFFRSLCTAAVGLPIFLGLNLLLREQEIEMPQCSGLLCHDVLSLNRKAQGFAALWHTLQAMPSST